MWLMTIFGYFSGKSELGRLSIWFTLLILQLSLCQAQKDGSAFGDGVKVNNNAFQTSQKGSELGEQSGAPRNSPRGVGNVRVSQTHANANNEPAPIPSQNAHAPSPPPSPTTSSSVESNEKSEVGAVPDRNSQEAAASRSQESTSQSPSAEDKDSEQEHPASTQGPKPKSARPHIPFARSEEGGDAVATTPKSNSAANDESAAQPASSGKGKPTKTSPSSGGGVGAQPAPESGVGGEPVQGGKRQRPSKTDGGGGAAKSEGEEVTKKKGGVTVSGDASKATPKPRGHIPNVGAADVGPPGAAVPNFASPQSDSIQHPPLAQRRPGPPSSQHNPADPFAKTATPQPSSLQGAGAFGSEETGEDPASGALIRAVNDEYVEVVKNLTEAGILTEADYESKPVSDLFALLLEKLINANPGVSEDDQHRLVHEAGLEFVEVFKANAAVTKNVTEIVRLVNEQLQSAQIVLNEGHGEPSANEPITPAITDTTNPSRLGGPSHSTAKNHNVNGESESLAPKILSANHSNLSATPANGINRRPLVAGGQSISSSIDTSENPTDQSGSISGTTSFPVKIGGDPNVHGVSKLNGGLANANGQAPNTTNRLETSINQQGRQVINNQQGSPSIDSAITTTESPIQEPVAVPVGSNRFPFPAQAPSTLRPPLRFFTTTSTVGSPTISEIGSDGESPKQHLTSSSPTFGQIGKGLGSSSSPGVGNRVIIGGNSDGGTVSSTGSPSIPNGNFPTPPAWNFSDGSTSGTGPIIGNNGGGLVGVSPSSSGISETRPNPTPNSSFASSILFPVSGSSVNGSTATESPISSTTLEEEDISAPFTHEVPTILGGSPSLASNLSRTNVVNVSGSPNASSTEGWLIDRTTPQLNASVTTTKPNLENASTEEAAFITESPDSKENKSSEDTSSSEVGTDLSSTKSPASVQLGSSHSIAPGNGTTSKLDTSIVSTTTHDPFDISTQSSSKSLGSVEKNISSGQSEIGSTTGVLVIGSDFGSSPLSNVSALTSTVATHSAETSVANSTKPSASTAASAESGTTEELEIEGSEEPSASEHTTSGGFSLPTRPILDNVTSAPDSGEKSTTTSATSSPSQNPVIIWNFKIVDPQTLWNAELLNKESFEYKELYGSLIKDLRTLFKTLDAKHFVDVSIKSFSKGSVVVEGQTEMSERVDSGQLLDSFVKLVAERKNTIGGREVDPNSITFDRHQNAPQSGSAATSGGGTPNWVIALVVAVVLLALVVIAGVVVIKRRKRQNSRDNYMVDEDAMGGGPKAWAPGHRANQHANGQQPNRGPNGLSNGRDQYSGVNMYEMKEPATQNAHLNYGYQADRASNGHGAHGRSVTEIHINAETNVDNEAASKH